MITFYFMFLTNLIDIKNVEITISKRKRYKDFVIIDCRQQND